MSGKGAIGVAVSGVQMLSVIASVWSTSPKIIKGQDHNGTQICLFCTQLDLLWLIFSGRELWICILGSVDYVSGFHFGSFGVVG